MRFSRFLGLLLLLLSLAAAGTSRSATAAMTGDPCSILFIGSSYFNFNDLPGLMKNLSLQSGRDVFIDQHIPSGYSLHDHLGDKTTIDKICSREWDLVVLQGSGARIAYPELHPEQPFYFSLESLCKIVIRNSSRTEIVLSMPWAFEDGMTWIEGMNEGFSEMHTRILERTLAYADSLDLLVAPVGQAWLRVLEEKNFPRHYLHMTDWNHPTLKGSYLSACVIYSSIFIETTAGLDYHSWLQAGEAKYFQQIAYDVVFDNPKIPEKSPCGR